MSLWRMEFLNNTPVRCSMGPFQLIPPSNCPGPAVFMGQIDSPCPSIHSSASRMPSLSYTQWNGTYYNTMQSQRHRCSQTPSKPTYWIVLTQPAPVPHLSIHMHDPGKVQPHSPVWPTDLDWPLESQALPRRVICLRSRQHNGSRNQGLAQGHYWSSLNILSRSTAYLALLASFCSPQFSSAAGYIPASLSSRTPAHD